MWASAHDFYCNMVECLVSWKEAVFRVVDRRGCSLGWMILSLDTAYGAGFYTSLIIFTCWVKTQHIYFHSLKDCLSIRNYSSFFDLATEGIQKQSVLQLLRYSLKRTRLTWIANVIFDDAMWCHYFPYTICVICFLLWVPERFQHLALAS